MRTLELTQLNDEMFYGHVLHSDLDAIVKNIRTTHEPDITTAEAAVDDMALVLPEAMDHKGTLDERGENTKCEIIRPVF